MVIPLDSASRMLAWSNRVYVTGAVLTLASAAMVLYERRSTRQGRAVRWGTATEIVVFVAAFVALSGTVGAIEFSRMVTHIKDVNLSRYEETCSVSISQANFDAQAAKEETERLRQANIRLQRQISNNMAETVGAEARLAQENKATSDFAHALAEQQRVMTNQARVSPVLNDEQISRLAEFLKPYSGQSVVLHSTADTTVQRLVYTINQALDKASIKHDNMINMGALYEGVSVAVSSPRDVPPLADAIVLGLRSAGIDVHTVSTKLVPAGHVGIFAGPN